MSSQRNQYHKFWANDDVHEYLQGLEKGSGGTLINQAIRYFANLSDYSDSTVGVNLAANVSNNVQPTAMRATEQWGSMSTYTGTDAGTIAPSSLSTVTVTAASASPIMNPILCPNGHLWMNGTDKCVNPKCTYGRMK